MDKQYYLTYKVEGFPTSFVIGPFSEDEAKYQKWDIENFEGISEVEMVLEVDFLKIPNT